MFEMTIRSTLDSRIKFNLYLSLNYNFINYNLYKEMPLIYVNWSFIGSLRNAILQTTWTRKAHIPLAAKYFSM